MFGGYNVRESLYARLTFWVNTILDHIVTRTNLSRYEGSCMIYINLNGYRKQNCRQILIPIPYLYKVIESLFQEI